MISRITFSVFAVLTILTLTSCSPDLYIEADSPLLRAANSQKTIGTYKIGVDDTVQINVWRNAELSVSVPVRPDGKISMPLIGDVIAAGYSPEDVAISIEKRLSKFIRDPNVTVIITGLKSHEYLTRLRVTGAVKNAQSLNYRQGMTVLDAILASGGVNDFASPDNTKLYRKINNKVAVINIYLGDILYKGKLRTNIELRPGDIITVPERLF